MGAGRRAERPHARRAESLERRQGPLVGAAAHRAGVRGEIRPLAGRPLPPRRDVPALAAGQAARCLSLRPARGRAPLPARQGLLVRVEAFLTGPELGRHVLQVHADPGPGRRAAAHRIDQHVGGLQVLGDFGVTRLPALEPRERVLLALGARDLDQRVLGSAGPGRLHPRGLAGLLLIVRRPGRVALPGALVPRRELEQALERPGALVYPLVAVAQLREPDVFGQPVSPKSRSVAWATPATARTWGHFTPGTGSRSTRSSSGWSKSSARTGCGCSSRQARLASHTSAAASRGTTSSAVRPEGKRSVTTSIHGGRDSGARF